MGFRFRKSVNLGPLRLNFSKSGVGYSIGGKGFRATKKAGGGYRTTISIPGTGISYVKDHGDNSSIPSKGAASDMSNSKSKKPKGKARLIIGILVVLLLISGIMSACDPESGQPVLSPSPVAITASPEPTTEATPTPKPTPTVTPTPTPEPTPTATPAPTPTPEPTPEPTPQEQMVWISNTGSKYHSKSGCSGMKDPQQVPISQAQSMGLTACKRCY